MKAIGVYTGHDSNLAISVAGEIKVVLELERMTNIRYYMPPESKEKFLLVWKKAFDLVANFTGVCQFDVCVSNWWVEVDHHVCHAALGFYDSPFNTSLVFSTDGGGNTGAFDIFTASREKGLTSIKKRKTLFGEQYLKVGSYCEEVAGPNFWVTGDPDVLPEGLFSTNPVEAEEYTQKMLAIAGKKMGYAALGKIRQEWFQGMKDIYGSTCGHMWFTVTNRLQYDDFSIKDKTVARDACATSQYWFTKEHTDCITKYLEKYTTNPDNPSLDGIVLSGGSAQNVFMSQTIVEKFGIPVHIACAPNDCGIAAGACYLIEPPNQFKPLLNLGLPLFDADRVDVIARERRARKVTVSDIADLLMKRDIVGVVRGRAKFGPRALGHRSILAYPDKREMLAKVNKLKRREFYRRACPSVAEESALKIFKGRKESDKFVSHEEGLDLFDVDERFSPNHPKKESCLFPDQSRKDNFIPRSPYMSFAPTMRDEVRDKFPAVCHFDNTARLQTVSKESEPWFYSLLQEIGKRNGGYEILINTSFNIKGKPILNELQTALKILDTDHELLPYVVCEDWQFTAMPTTPKLKA